MELKNQLKIIRTDERNYLENLNLMNEDLQNLREENEDVNNDLIALK